MKYIRTACGVKRVGDSASPGIVLKVREILTEYRSMLISRLMTDLNTYIDYKFSRKPDISRLQIIKERLHVVRNSPLDMGRYEAIVHDVLAKEMVYVSATLFFQEIDETIGRELHTDPMLLSGK